MTTYDDFYLYGIPIGEATKEEWFSVADELKKAAQAISRTTKVQQMLCGMSLEARVKGKILEQGKEMKRGRHDLKELFEYAGYGYQIKSFQLQQDWLEYFSTAIIWRGRYPRANSLDYSNTNLQQAQEVERSAIYLNPWDAFCRIERDILGVI